MGIIFPARSSSSSVNILTDMIYGLKATRGSSCNDRDRRQPSPSPPRHARSCGAASARNKAALLGLILFALVVLAAILPARITPGSPLSRRVTDPLTWPLTNPAVPCCR